jgi:hypothetical protein
VSLDEAVEVIRATLEAAVIEAAEIILEGDPARVNIVHVERLIRTLREWD